jgi:hypothetical protein
MPIYPETTAYHYKPIFTEACIIMDAFLQHALDQIRLKKEAKKRLPTLVWNDGRPFDKQAMEKDKLDNELANMDTKDFLRRNRK